MIGFSEYGADANPAFHSSHPEKGDYTEGYQALYHEHMLRMMGRMTMLSLLKQGGADEQSIKQPNRILQGIKK